MLSTTYLLMKREGYTRKANKVYLINYHFVWCPKRRTPVLKGRIKNRLIEIFKQVASEHDIKILALEVMPDHLHMFVSAPPTFSPHIITKRFKGTSARILRREFPQLQRMTCLWTRSYFVSTAGNVSSKTIKEYILAQSRRN